MSTALSDQALDQLFRTARTANAFADKPVSDDTLRDALQRIGDALSQLR